MAAAEAELVPSADAHSAPGAAGTAASPVAAAAAAAAAAPTGSQAQVCKAALAAKLLSLSGVFAVHKPRGPTSAELLNRLKGKLLAEAGMPSPEWNKRQRQTLKLGHGGTLDSAAQGVLVVGIGRGTKMLTSMLSGSKRYIAIGELGKATDTLDSTGKVTDEKPYDKITREDIEGILQKFTGNILQVPPLYSALKQGGQRLSALMKRGEAVEARPARPVTVHSISLLSFQPPLFTLDVECGGGFYIRSLVNDIGRVLGAPRKFRFCLPCSLVTREWTGHIVLIVLIAEQGHCLPHGASCSASGCGVQVQGLSLLRSSSAGSPQAVDCVGLLA